MRQGWMRGAGWTLTSGAMVALSWYGVRTVLTEPDGGTTHAAYAAPAWPTATASPSGTPSPSASPSPSRTSAAPSPSPSADRAAASPTVRASPTRTAPSPAVPTGERSYTVSGGTAVFDLRPASATLVSATPRQGWAEKVITRSDWIRVIFYGSGGNQFSSVTCSWQGHPPTVQTYPN